MLQRLVTEFQSYAAANRERHRKYHGGDPIISERLQTLVEAWEKAATEVGKLQQQTQPATGGDDAVQMLIEATHEIRPHGCIAGELPRRIREREDELARLRAQHVAVDRALETAARRIAEHGKAIERGLSVRDYSTEAAVHYRGSLEGFAHAERIVRKELANITPLPADVAADPRA